MAASEDADEVSHMTFRERQNRLTKLLCVLVALALVPWLMNLLDMGDFTGAGMALYALTFLAFALPAGRLAVQHARSLHRHEPRKG